MPYAKGRNAGLTGLIDLPGAGTPAFACQVYGWKAALELRDVVYNGPGTYDWKQTVHFLPGGNLFVTAAKINGFGWPSPLTFVGQDGTVTLQFDAGKTVSLPVHVIGQSLQYSEGSERMSPKSGTAPVAGSEQWDIGLTCEISGQPIWLGWPGTQPAATALAAFTQETWEGQAKTFDPNLLAGSAGQRYLLWAYTWIDDTADANKLASMLAAATSPLTGTKPRTATGARLAAGLFIVTIQYAPTNTADDQVNPRSPVVTDAAPLTISSTNDQAVLWTPGGTEPTAPTVAGLKLATYQDLKLNDKVMVRVWRFAATDSNDQALFPRTAYTLDQGGQDLTSKSDIPVLSIGVGTGTTPTTPTGQVLNYTEDVPVTGASASNLWIRIYHYTKRTAQQAEEMDHSPAEVDPNAITTVVRVSHVTSSSTAPTPDAAPAGTKYIKTESQQLDPGHWRWTFVYSTRDSIDDIQLPGTSTSTDPYSIDSTAEQTSIYLTGASVPAAVVPTGMQLVATSTRVYDLTHSLVVYKFAVTNSQQRATFPKTQTLTDTNTLDGINDQAQVYTYGSAPSTPPASVPSGLKLINIVDVPLAGSSSQWVRIWHYGTADSKDKALFPHTRTTQDVSDLHTELLSAVLFTAGSPPSDPTAPTDPTASISLVLIDRTDLPLTGATASNQWARIYRWGKQTAAQELVNRNTHVLTDSNNIQGEATFAALDGTPPTGSVPSGFVARELVALQQTPDHVLNKQGWGLRGTTDDLTMPATNSDQNPMAIYVKDTATVLTCTSSQTADQLAIAAVASYYTDPTLESLRVLKHNQVKAVQILKQTGLDMVVSAIRFHQGEDTALAFPYGTASGSTTIPNQATGDVSYAWCHVTSSGSGGLEGYIQHQKVWRTRGIIHLRRRKIVTAANLGSLYFDGTAAGDGTTNLVGCVNNARFLGYPAYSLMYTGPMVRYCLALDSLYGGPAASGHLVIIDYQFLYDLTTACNVAPAPFGGGWVQYSHANDTMIPYGRVYAPAGAGWTASSMYANAVIYWATPLQWPLQVTFGTGNFLS